MSVHDPEFAEDWRTIVSETLPALEECRRAGKIRRIGVTGYPLDLQVCPDASCACRADHQSLQR